MHCADVISAVHTFRVGFIAINVRVLMREPVVLLNGAEETRIGREHLLASAFPTPAVRGSTGITRDQLVYHVVEPPK